MLANVKLYIVIMKYPILVLLSLFLLSCSKEAIQQGNNGNPFNGPFYSISSTPAQVEFYNFYAEAHNGQVLINEGHPLNADVLNSGSVDVSGWHDNSAILNQLQLNQFIIDHNESNLFQSSEPLSAFLNLFGDSVEIKYGDSYDETIDLPEIIYANTDINGQINPGSVIEWNEDHSNTNGVVVIIEFNPNSFLQQQDFSAYSERTNIVFVEDDGNYAIQEEMFENIPVEAFVKLTVLRGNYLMSVSNDNTTNCRIIGFSGASGIRQYTN